MGTTTPSDRARILIGRIMVQIRNICEGKSYEEVISWMIADGYASLGEHVQRGADRTTAFWLKP
jgi:hypothetical protein